MRALTDAWLVDAVRTPIGRYGGGLASVRPDDLAAHVLAALLARQPALAERVDHVVLGATNQAGEDNRNVARMAALLAGLPDAVPAVTVNRLCGSGLEAVTDAAMRVWTGDAEVVIAGGVESMTRAPFAFRKPASAFDRTPPEVFDTTLGWRFENPRLAARFPLDSMGMTAENVARRWGVSREAQDAWALSSQQRAAAAIEAGAFTAEIVPVEVPQARGPAVIVAADESPRPQTTPEALAKLKPVFAADGSVTAGNSSPLNDGAAALLVVSDAVVRSLGLQPLARIAAFATAGVEPNYMGEGPIPATRRALDRAGWTIADLEHIELNEAFAAQVLADIEGLGLDPARVNPLGGAIALGHPIGASGARIAGTLAHAMARGQLRRGLAALCIGVGQGIACCLER
jgi:acetyl-CoA acyltransferase